MPPPPPPRPGQPNTETLRHRVAYSETDRMGWVYYGNYAALYERGRTELLRALGHRYRDIEDNGLMLPVRKCCSRHRQPARYDDEIRIVTGLSRIKRASLTFITAIYNMDGTLLSTGTVELACVDTSGRPHALPQDLFDDLRKRRMENDA